MDMDMDMDMDMVMCGKHHNPLRGNESHQKRKLASLALRELTGGTATHARCADTKNERREAREGSAAQT